MRYLLDQDRAREWRRQTALMQRLENQFVARLSTEIYNATSDMVDRWKMTNEVTYPRGFREKLEDAYRQMIVAAATSFGVRVWQQAKSIGRPVERKEDFAQTMLLEAMKYLAREVVRQRIDGVEMTTRQEVIRAIARGFVEGLGQNEIADKIMEAAPQISENRAKTIARTEIHGAANFGSLEAAKRTGVSTKKEWLSAQDKRTRTFSEGDEYDHLNFDGTVVGMEEAFVFTSRKDEIDAIQHPGDPSGAAANCINCRCTLAFPIDLDALLSEPSSLPFVAPSKPDALAPVVPATIKAIAEYIVVNLIAKVAKIDGMNALALGLFAKRAAEIHQRFNLKPLEGVGPATRFGERSVKNANAAIYSGTKNGEKFGIFHMPTKFGNIAEYERQHRVNVSSSGIYKARAQARLESLAGLDSEVLKRFSNLRSGEYSWSVTGLMDPGRKVIGLTDHEYGHVLHLVDKNIGAKIDQFIATYNPLKKGWGNLLSEYANANSKEYVAEAFALYMADDTGQYYRIHPELLKIFQKADRR